MLRNLHIKDASLMLEWMHDKRVNQKFAKDFTAFQIEDVLEFIRKNETKFEKHYAIVNENDEYLGTASLQKISRKDLNAELSIVFRYEYFQPEMLKTIIFELISIAFNILKLNRLYLNILEDDFKSIQVYEELGFMKEGTFVGQRFIGGKYQNISWYAMSNPQLNVNNQIEPHQILRFKEMGDNRGHLVVIEGCIDVPFEIKRIFYIYGSNSSVIRGQHANRKTEFVLINIAGTSKIKVDNGISTEIVELDRPHMGIYLPKMLWKEMFDFTPDSVLLVLASEHYDGSEYIRDYDQFIADVSAEPDCHSVAELDCH